jgi:hypothetical protein
MGLVIGTGVLIIVAVIRNRPTPAQQAASDAQRDGFSAAFVCQSAVRDRLKAPAGAEFQAPRHADITRLTDGYKIVSFVDASNSFGAKIRTPYTCLVGTSGAGFKIVALDIQNRR